MNSVTDFLALTAVIFAIITALLALLSHLEPDLADDELQAESPTGSRSEGRQPSANRPKTGFSEMTFVMVALPLLLMGAAGCADTTRQAAQPAPSSAASSAILETLPVTCMSVTSSQGLVLHKSWVDVVASKGLSDHQRRVERFAEEADKAADGARPDDPCAEVKEMAARLSSEAARLVAWVLIDEADVEWSKYQAVADKGNTLMRELGVDKVFETPGLTGP